MWKRPTALASELYKNISVPTLHQCYARDSEQARQAKVSIPPRPKDASFLRVAQWNVHYFLQAVHPHRRIFHDVYDELCRHDPDVIVLNEFGTSDALECAPFFNRLRQLGYRHAQVATIGFPTAIFTRWEKVDRISSFALDEMRHAVVMRLSVDAQQKNSSTDSDNGRHVWIYGTHLNDIEDVKGRRFNEMKALLTHVQKNVHQFKGDAVLIVGDLNQQRPQDYFPDEWNRIVANKAHRGESIENDGVADLLQSSGFACVWDMAPPEHRNWPVGQPPPCTHWSGTLIDYIYSSERNIQNVGTYVSPCDCSDHRLIISDWKIL